MSSSSEPFSGASVPDKTPNSVSSPNPGEDWFSRLTGFRENGVAGVQDGLRFADGKLTSLVNGREYQAGRLEVVSLGELRQRLDALQTQAGTLSVKQQVADVRDLHGSVGNAGATFQVASQFNLLEMVSPSITPEQGVGIYENDPTQGPACAVACGAGTIFRNYFVPLGDRIGQSAHHQIDCLEEVGRQLGNDGNRLWTMKNGYALPTSEGLREINAQLDVMSDEEIDLLRANVKVGVQSHTQVTIGQCEHAVTQVYCSAMPVAYSDVEAVKWKAFATLILEAAYEATFAAAVLNGRQTQNRELYLTLLGGGAFGNSLDWIIRAIKRACIKFRAYQLTATIVSHRSPNEQVTELVDSFRQAKEKRDTGENLPNHRCPVCAKSLAAFSRYPWYICHDCLRLAEDGQGKRLRFGNHSLSGGLDCGYESETEVKYPDCGSVICTILGRPVIVSEARFGGVVAQPLHSNLLLPGAESQSIDLRRTRS